jgi:hypothetical protein
LTLAGCGAGLNQERDALAVEEAEDFVVEVESSLAYELVRCLLSISGTGSRLRPRCSSSEVLLLRDPKTILSIEIGEVD